MTTIIVRNNNVEKAIRSLKRKVQKNGLIKELRDRQYYQKPSEKKREKNKAKMKKIFLAQKKWDELNGIVIVKGKKVKKL
ncbi:MAG: 30S ribosomal protein S21 [Porticoccaceae bacterium]|nr:30S ribosomal protein S21 [Porticoccaceae bacterium]OUW58418.1 MAG: 30S ribosomal protein S21 [Candidatus Pelagibacter sp. TMED197]